MTPPLATSHFRSARFACLALALCLNFTASAESATAPAASTPTAMRRVFDWQLAHLWSTEQGVEHRWGTRGWVHGAFLTGVMEAYRSTGDNAYLNYAWRTARRNEWKLGPRFEHADDYIVGQTYVELYQLSAQSGQLDDTRERLDALMADPKFEQGRDLWWWCDALYMAPPTMAKIALATKDDRYLAQMDKWYWDAYDALFDHEEHLFYRDKRFLNPNDGQKIFWSRGNGWVLAGLARLLDVLPPNHPSRDRYVALFQEMAAKIVAIQPADGLWHANLLRPEATHGEASGSAFFCYALAWGINHGLLPAADYRPAVERTWTALQTCVDVEGKLGWVQPIGSAPDHYDATTFQEYGAGAFLAAGSQVMELP